MADRQVLRAYLPVLAGAIVLAAIPLALARTPALYSLARGAALVGYLFVALAVISSAYIRPLVKRYRKPFVSLHHWVSITGLVLLVIHPLLLVIVNGSIDVLLMAYRSWDNLLTYGGSTALLMLLIAALMATKGGRQNRFWRYVHWLTYLVLILGTVHAVRLGTSVATLPALRIVLILIAIAGAVVFVVKRTGRDAGAKRPAGTKPRADPAA
jgi:predicted ferric reductase